MAPPFFGGGGSGGGTPQRLSYRHRQDAASSVWIIAHGLGFRPAGVQVTDSDGDDVEVATVDVTAPPANQGPVIFEGDDGSTVTWIPGEYHTLLRVNLGTIRARGTPGDVLTLVGGTW